MYLTEATIRHFRSLREVSWKLSGSEQGPGWHVIVGDNGSGKTSFLRALALGLIGPEVAQQLRQSWDLWLAKGEVEAEIALSLVRNIDLDKASGSGPGKNRFVAKIDIHRTEAAPPVLTGRGGERYLWGAGEGWFSASYGPLRRFTGGSVEQQKLFYKLPKLGRHLSLFDESVALTECLDWLKDLRFKELEQRPEGALLSRLRAFVNQDGFLPFGVRLHDVSSAGVTFLDGNGNEVEIENLSDGYRSVLSMTFELIRQLSLVYPAEAVFSDRDPARIHAAGIVLVDEIDAHLHPTWQRRIGVWMRDHFPKIQFIVTTHSPIICQAADVGTVFRLPRPGVEEPGEMLQGEELKRLVFGSILEAFGTEVFGENVTRSEASERFLDELAALNVKELAAGLTPDEQQRQRELRSILPTTAYQLDKAS